MSADPRNAREGGFDARYVDALANVEDRHFWFRARAQLIAGLVQRLTPSLPADYRVLEVGCGTGSVLQTLQGACPGHLTVGLDSLFEGLVHARRRSDHSARVLQGDARQPPFRQDVRFDLVGLFDVLEHIPDDRLALVAARGLMRPGGVLLVTVPASPALWSEFDEAAHHCRRYTQPTLRTALVESGFRVEFLSPFMTSLFPLVWFQRRAIGYGGDHAKKGAPLPDLRVVPVVNGLLASLLRLESAWVAGRRRMPFGVSLVAVARLA